MDIEVFNRKDELKAFVFFTSSNPLPKKKLNDAGTAGCFYIVTLPKVIAKKPITFNLATQSWGRVCSKFSPSIVATPKKPEAGNKESK